MSASNPLNVYTGPDSLRKYYDPDIQPPLPLVEVPAALNPFYADGVRIYAKMMSMHPANNVKALPAMNLLASAMSPATKTVIEYSSGSTVISMSLMARIFHSKRDTRAYLSNKTSDAKLKLMQFFGLDLTLFGGPSQPEPLDQRGGICKAAADAGKNGGEAVNPDQYGNDANWQAHEKWTGPQILRQLPSVNVICAGMGTSGTMTGIGTFIKRAKPSVVRVGVCTAAGDRVPGPRSYALLAPVTFPWRAAVDAIEHVGSFDSYSLSMQLSREGLICGPSSGFNLKGLYQFLDKRKAAGTLDLLSEPTSSGGDGLVHCVFICCDLPYQYINEYFAKLGPEHFPAIHNYNLAAVDLYRYDEAWEVPATDALQRIYDMRIEQRRGRPLTRATAATATATATPALSTSSALSSTTPSLSPPSSVSSASAASTSAAPLSSARTSTSPSPAPLPPSRNALVIISALKPRSVLLDLRAAADYARWHLPGALNAPLASLADADAPSPFAEAGTLERQWRELEALFGGGHPGAAPAAATAAAPAAIASNDASATAAVSAASTTTTSTTPRAAAEAATTALNDLSAEALSGRADVVVLLCYAGDTARVAASVLRAKGVAAFSVRGGVRALAHEWPELLRAESQVSDDFHGHHVAADADEDGADDDEHDVNDPASPASADYDSEGRVHIIHHDPRTGSKGENIAVVGAKGFSGVRIAGSDSDGESGGDGGGDGDGDGAWSSGVMRAHAAADEKAPRNVSGSDNCHSGPPTVSLAALSSGMADF